jgi:hypothetical protein
MDPLPAEMLEAKRTNDRCQEIGVGECTEPDVCVQYGEKWYVVESNHLGLLLILHLHNTALARHPGRA